jgi:DNA-binding CsgD family transcriptional regulator
MLKNADLKNINTQALTQMQQELVQLTRTVDQLGTIVLTSDLKVHLMTPKAWELLREYFSISSDARTCLPENLLRWIRHQISQLNQTVELCSICLPLQLEREGKQLVVRLIREQLGEQYLLLLEEQILHTLSIELLELLGLTKREAEVLFWVTQDKSDKEIATILNLRAGTIKKHLEHVYQKLGVQTRIAAVMYALKSLGILKY